MKDGLLSSEETFFYVFLKKSGILNAILRYSQ